MFISIIIYFPTIITQFKRINYHCNVNFRSSKDSNYFSLKDVTPLTLMANVVYSFKEFCDKTQPYICKTKRHLAVRVQEHLSGKSGKSANNENISSCKDCHSCYISNFYTFAQANTDIEAKIKESLYIQKYKPNINISIIFKYINQIYSCGSSSLSNIKKQNMDCIS